MRKLTLKWQCHRNIHDNVEPVGGALRVVAAMQHVTGPQAVRMCYVVQRQGQKQRPFNWIMAHAQLVLGLLVPQLQLSSDGFFAALTCSQVSHPTAVPEKTTSASDVHTADAEAAEDVSVAPDAALIELWLQSIAAGDQDPCLNGEQRMRHVTESKGRACPKVQSWLYLAFFHLSQYVACTTHLDADRSGGKRQVTLDILPGHCCSCVQLATYGGTGKGGLRLSR